MDLVDPATAVAEVVSGNERGRRHHVGAGRQDPDELIDVDPHGVVDDTVRFQREQRVDIIGSRHADRRDAGEVTGVAADLLR